MPKIRQAVTNFTSGELSPLMGSRFDTKLFRNGAQSLKNFMILAQGGAKTRPGLKYLTTISGSGASVKLLKFVFNNSQKYIFAFSNARADIYDTSGTLLTSITGAPWTTAMLPRLTCDQFGDTMILCHPDMPMQKILRTGASSFTTANLTFEQNSAGQPMYQPYYKFADSAITMTPSATTGSGITLTLSGAGAWTANHVGLIVRYKKKECLITGYTNANVVTATVRETLPGTTADLDWDEPVFSAVRGYANCATFWNNRLCLGGSKSRPTGIWLSKVGAYFNFDLGTSLDNEAVWDAINGSRLTEILHLVGYRHLLIFTDSSVFYCPWSTTQVQAITPKTFNAREQQPYGSNYCKPSVFDSATIFCQDTGAIVREALWVDTTQSYEANPVSLLSPHLISSPTQLDVLYGSSSRAEQYAFLVNGNGKLSVFHSIRSESVAGWVPWETTGTIQSVCCVLGDIFLAVTRTLNGVSVTTLEKFDDTIAPLDCQKKVTSAASTTFSGFTHLANMTVSVVSQGHDLGDYTVSAGGVITLNSLASPVTELEAGLSYQQTLLPMPAIFDLPDGISQGQQVSLVRSVLQVDQSGSFTVNGNAILLDFTGDSFTAPASTVSGNIEVRRLGYDASAQPEINVNRPVKVTILGVMREVKVNG